MNATTAAGTGYRAAYDAVLAQWPGEPEALQVSTDQGRTQVYATGPAGAPPLVLIPGGGATAAAWFAVAHAVGGTHRIYAVDTMGDAGRSEPTRKLTGRDDLVNWLGAVLDGLGVPAAALAGHSYGAWTALAFALRAPDRVTKLALLDPTSCFAPLAPGYVLRALPLLLTHRPAAMDSVLRWETRGQHLDPAWRELMCLGATQPSRIVMPRRPNDAEFAGFTVPTLVALAERSRAHDVRKVAASARRVLPGAGLVTISGAAHHTIPTEHGAGELAGFL
jgi:pimeloyl-ACP methyl ester carboxylesterase